MGFRQQKNIDMKKINWKKNKIKYNNAKTTFETLILITIGVDLVPTE